MFKLGLIVFLIIALAPATVLAEDKVDANGGAESGAETSDSGASPTSGQSDDTGTSSESSSDSGPTGAATTSEPGCSDLESSGSETEAADASQKTDQDAATPAEDTGTSDSYDATPSQDTPDLTETSPSETPSETSSESDDQNSETESPEAPTGSPGEDEAASASGDDTAGDPRDADGVEAGAGDADGVETDTPDADGDVDSDDTGSENQEAKVEGEEGNSYTAEITSEKIVKVNGSNRFTVKFTEVGSDTQLGSVTMTIPEEFTGLDFNATDIKTSGGQSWTGGLVDKVLALWAADNADGNYLGQDEWVSATFTATTPDDVGEYDFVTEAWQNAENHTEWQTVVDSSGSRPESGVGTDGNSMAAGHSDPVVSVNDGTAEHPYQVFTANHLNEVREELSVNYIQMEDIDLGNYLSPDGDGHNEGNGWKPIGDWDNRFTGRFDGNNYTISNLFINQPDDDYVGLFGYVDSDGVIKNVSLENGNITGKDYVGGLVGFNEGTITNSYATGAVTGNWHVGGLVGINSGTITNSYATGAVNGLYSVGGLIGYNWGTITNSYSTGDVNGDHSVGGLVGNNWSTITGSYATGDITGNDHVGGLVGENRGRITNSYSTGAVDGNDYVGGLVGENRGTITNSYSTNAVDGNDYVGGLVGRNNGGTINDSFWDTDTSGQTTSNGGTGKTTAEMQQLATFFDAGWKITGEDGFYPLLWWQVGDDDTYTWHMTEFPAPSPDPDPGLVDVIGWDFIGSYNFSDTITISAFAGVRALTAITGGVDAIITPAFISSGNQFDLAQALLTYQALLQLYEEEKELLSASQLALFETELAIAWAAILALEASLLEQDGEHYDLVALIAAYETAEAVLGRNSALLSAGQIAAAQSLLQAIAAVIAGLTA